MNKKNDLYDAEYTEYQLNRSRLRKLIRGLYLKHILKKVKGKTIDFGCGVGELLSMLPAGSIGMEVNEATVRYCQGRGLPVVAYNPDHDEYRFAEVTAGDFSTFVTAHVLEHIENAEAVLRKMLSSCARLGIQRVIVVVPGIKGFQFDNTHKTFIDRRFFAENRLEDHAGYRIVSTDHFPFPFSLAGKYFTHNELTVVYER
jgi:hypothetical protein